ncbi:AAA family ATPase [Haliangium ochraceum]|uniref:ATPase associated with various cellular activities AAA_5 n=1 Tax=Haliangium ochraceum (strain DSM 14365 / JCM 11303 / SMP-2) TaxID=502025 RepID=D0LHH2_HALO1|nr:AAA family ATPase [Haliangium ochraceum]ACY12834.1 ATPase associated with various cellular activities AAA_5 [Haliangium ochraceum DSM 14365]
MPWPEDIQTAIRQLQVLRRSLQQTFTGRDQVVEVLALGAVCQEHTLLLGPPGTGKTELVTRFTQAVDAPLFSYLLTRFTEPSEIFGPLDVEAFQGGRYHIRTDGMLPSASIAFLDEVFQGSSAILNTLLTLVHERVFHNGAERQRVPLLSLVGASNELPADSTLRAFSDRFVLRVAVAPVPDPQLDELLDKGWLLERARMEAPAARELPTLSEDALRSLHGRLHEVAVDQIRSVYAQVLRELRAEGVEFSDRRMVKGLKLIAGAALMDNRTSAGIADLWPLSYMWTTDDEAELVRPIVAQHLGDDDGARLAGSGTRSGEELRGELALLASREDALRGHSALGAHLMALGRLRREAILDHPDDDELRAAVEGAVSRVMALLEGPAPRV